MFVLKPKVWTYFIRESHTLAAIKNASPWEAVKYKTRNQIFSSSAFFSPDESVRAETNCQGQSLKSKYYSPNRRVKVAQSKSKEERTLVELVELGLIWVGFGMG